MNMLNFHKKVKRLTSFLAMGIVMSSCCYAVHIGRETSNGQLQALEQSIKEKETKARYLHEMRTRAIGTYRQALSKARRFGDKRSMDELSRAEARLHRVNSQYENVLNSWEHDKERRRQVLVQLTGLAEGPISATMRKNMERSIKKYKCTLVSEGENARRQFKKILEELA